MLGRRPHNLSIPRDEHTCLPMSSPQHTPPLIRSTRRAPNRTSESVERPSGTHPSDRRTGSLARPRQTRQTTWLRTAPSVNELILPQEDPWFLHPADLVTTRRRVEASLGSGGSKYGSIIEATYAGARLPRPSTGRANPLQRS
ncbi:hypothetical protein QAD02_015146 [Eretmocerus hayati]|uniref:Uncharacterized protein n=1 Tax=Eretmocerus hayati TaxID=131215 RepID=A0ACC2P707_9HYME|nr:hypothetical protein QAD02_015146 [Eretmocerus hayati]